MDKHQSSASASIGGMGVRRGFGGPRGMPPQKAKDFKGTLRQLWGYMKGLRAMLLVVVLLVLASSVLVVLFPMLIGAAVDAMGLSAGAVDFPLLAHFLTILACAYFTNIFISFLQNFIMAGVSQRFVHRLRTALFCKLQNLPLGFFDSHESGDIMSRITNDMDTISGTVGQAAVQLITGALSVFGTLAMMFWISPILACAVLITVPMIFLLTKVVTKRTGSLFRKQQNILGMLNSHMEESVSGIKTVRAYGRERQVEARFEELNQSLREVGTKAQIWSGYIMPLLNVINNLGFVLVSFLGGILAVNGMLTVGAIASFVSLTRQFVRPLNEIANTYNTLLSAVAGAERVFEILSEREEPEDPPDAAVLVKPAGDVIFENVSFGYRPDQPVLRDVSFHIKPGMRAAFVGPTGAGKTTIINLLTRFYDVTDGAILLDGIDLRDTARASVRATFGVVLQDTYLFGGTIRDNIRYGRLEASDGEVEQAAKTAGADHFITRLKNGYDTLVSDNGGNLSAGQRQLLALSRAVLCDPPILILDEATSSVDTRTELRIQRIMAQLMANRTTFVIAHRLGTIRDADIIMVVDGGRIVEAGSHAELMTAKGIYERMYTSQLGEVQ